MSARGWGLGNLAGSSRGWAGCVLAAALAFAPLGADEARAQQPNDECCPLLLIPVGARSGSMGGAITAQQGPELAFRNPAGLAGVGSNTFVIHHSDDPSVNAQLDAFSLVLTPLGVSLALSYQLFDRGETQATNIFGEVTGEILLRDHLLITSLGVPLPAGVSAGVSHRLFQERIDCNGQCGGAESVTTRNALDAGLRYNPAWRPQLELGLAVVNLGAATAEPGGASPARLHLGVTYDVLAGITTDDLIAVRVALEAIDRVRLLGSPTWAAGAEVGVRDAVFLRAGYVPGSGLGTGAAVGVEFRYDRFDIAVSRSFVSSQLDASEPFKVSFGLNF